MGELIDYHIGQIAQSTRSTESALNDVRRMVAEIRETQENEVEHVEAVKTALEELTTWAQRLAVLAVLWAAALGINLAPDKLAETLAVLLKSPKP